MEIKKFKGLKNVTSAERLAPGQLEVAQNIDIDDTGKILTRLGTALVSTGTYHSLWADGDYAYVVSGQDLCQINPDFTTTVLHRLSSAGRLSYARAQGTVYFTNGVDKGRIRHGGVGEWGVRPPVGQPVAVAGAGTLPAGRYLYALTHLRFDGQESGTGAFGSIELTVPGGIDFSSIESSSDVDVLQKCLYLSGPNGTELFHEVTLASQDSTYSCRKARGGRRLETEFANPPVAGTIAEIHSGRMYVVRDNAAYFSDPFNYERFRGTQFLMLPGPITMWASVNDGIYASTPDGTWFFQGKDPQEMSSRQIFPYGAIPGTAVKTTLGALKSVEEVQEGEPAQQAVLFTTPHGVCVGGEGGTAANLTERDFSFPTAQRGAGVLRQVRGYTQYLAVLEGSGVAANPYS